MRDLDGRPVMFPKTAEEWAEPRWVDYACHADAPWLDDRLRQRIHDFVTVLRCRYPTVQDLRSPAWAKHGLRAMAGWRYQHGKYARPWELELIGRAAGRERMCEYVSLWVVAGSLKQKQKNINT